MGIGCTKRQRRGPRVYSLFCVLLLSRFILFVCVSRGMIPRTVEQLFTTIADLRTRAWSYTIRMSMLELYNEEIRDLLAPADVAENIKYKIQHDKGDSDSNNNRNNQENDETSMTRERLIDVCVHV